MQNPVSAAGERRFSGHDEFAPCLRWLAPGPGCILDTRKRPFFAGGVTAPVRRGYGIRRVQVRLTRERSEAVSWQGDRLVLLGGLGQGLLRAVVLNRDLARNLVAVAQAQVDQ